jgi:hypothetical protein
MTSLLKAAEFIGARFQAVTGTTGEVESAVFTTGPDASGEMCAAMRPVVSDLLDSPEDVEVFMAALDAMAESTIRCVAASTSPYPAVIGALAQVFGMASRLAAGSAPRRGNQHEGQGLGSNLALAGGGAALAGDAGRRSAERSARAVG